MQPRSEVISLVAQGGPQPSSLCLSIPGWSQRGPPSHPLVSSQDPQTKETFGTYGEVAPIPVPLPALSYPVGHCPQLPCLSLPCLPRAAFHLSPESSVSGQWSGWSLWGCWDQGTACWNISYALSARCSKVSHEAKALTCSPPRRGCSSSASPAGLGLHVSTHRLGLQVPHKPPGVLACSWEEARSP